MHLECWWNQHPMSISPMSVEQLFVSKLSKQLHWTCSLNSYFSDVGKSTSKLLIKCWWNWLHDDNSNFLNLEKGGINIPGVLMWRWSKACFFGGTNSLHKKMMKSILLLSSFTMLKRQSSLYYSCTFFRCY